MRKCNQPGCNKKTHLETYMCQQHLKEYRAEYYQKTKNQTKPNLTHHDDPETIAKGLRGELTITGGGLFEGCTEKQIRDMKAGDFKSFIES